MTDENVIRPSGGIIVFLCIKFAHIVFTKRHKIVIIYFTFVVVLLLYEKFNKKRNGDMNNDVIFAFSVFQLTFLFLDVFILLRTSRDIARKSEYVWFRVLIFTHLVYLICNSLWSLAEYDILKISRPVLTVICTFSLLAVTNCSTSFFLFVTEKLQVKRLISGVGLWLRQIPAFIFSALIVTSPWTGWVFRLNQDQHIEYEGMYLPIMILSSLYLLGVAVVAAVNLFRARTTFLRKANGALLGSVLGIFLFVFVDGMMVKASVLPAAVFAVILIIFITLQESNINSDVLTGMNNRRKAEEYLTEALSGVSETFPMYLYIGDINGFKGINDTYGHIEGDDALIICGNALKRATERVDGFAARFGGDEFLIAWRPEKGKDTDPEIFIRDLDRQIEELSGDKPYKLGMSVGFVRCTDPKTTLNAYIVEADEMLYRKKALIYS